MKNDKGPLSWLKNLFKQSNGEGENKEKKPSKYAYVLTVLLLGVGIMMVSNILTNKDSEQDAVTTFNQSGSPSTKDIETFGQKNDTQFKSVTDYEKYLQNEMKVALESIAGVEEVKVVVYVEASEKKVFEKNKVTQKQTTEETDKEGGIRKVEDTSVDDQLVILKGGDKEGPIIVETKKPKISGVLIVAKGAENIQIKKWIIEAVTRALDVPSHRVSVMPKK